MRSSRRAVSSIFWSCFWSGLIFLGGCRPIADTLKDLSHFGRPQPVPSQAAQDPTKANTELLYEMFTVVFLREPGNKVEFGDFVNVLNQGASLEGLFNGFSHSAFYRRLEEDPSTHASPGTLKVFSRELLELERAQLEPRHFVKVDGLPLARATEPSTLEAAPTPTSTSAVTQTETASIPQTVDEYQILFSSSSFYTLKRILSDEFLRLVDARTQKDSGALKEWMAHWCVRMSDAHVDFGVASRASTDIDFHRRWIEKTPPDRMKWEGINRLQRLINVSESKERAANETATTKPTSASKPK